MKDFFYNIYGLISSFAVMSVFWVYSMYFFEYLKYPTEIVTLIAIVFCVLILITPTTTVDELQYRNWQGVVVLSILQIFNSMMSMLLWWFVGNRKNLQAKEIDNRTKKKMFINLTIIPSLYVISIGLSFVNFNVDLRQKSNLMFNLKAIKV